MRRVPGRRALSDERERGPAAVVTNMVTHDQQTTSAVARDWDMLIERRVDFAKDDPTHRGHRIHVRRTIPNRYENAHRFWLRMKTLPSAT